MTEGDPDDGAGDERPDRAPGDAESDSGEARADGTEDGPDRDVTDADANTDGDADDNANTDATASPDSEREEPESDPGTEEGADDSEGEETNVTLSADPPELGPYDPEDYATEMHTPGSDAPGAGQSVGAPDDQEMPLTEHIEEMIRRLAVVIVVMAAVSAVAFPFGDRLITFLWYSFLPGPASECVQAATAAASNFTSGAAAGGAGANATAGSTTAACPRLYHPLSLVLSRLKVASLTGFIMALPVFVYETYLFMRPGLYPNERRYYLASVPTSLILAGVGVAFAYFLVLPVIFTYFLGYSEPVAEIAFGLSETFGLILLMLGMFAAIFQIPLFVMLAIMMGVTSRRWLEDRRLYFWFGFGGLAFLFSPDPTGMAPFIVAVTMIVLFEGTLLVLRWTDRGDRGRADV